MNKLSYITILSTDTQKSIKHELIKLGLSDDDIEMAMNGRLADLEDTICIAHYLQ